MNLVADVGPVARAEMCMRGYLVQAHTSTRGVPGT